MDKKKITPTLRTMAVGQTETFPLDRLTSVRNIIYANLMPERLKGYRWSVRSNVDDGQLIVTRVQ